jgi:hypothetical protein
MGIACFQLSTAFIVYTLLDIQQRSATFSTSLSAGVFRFSQLKSEVLSRSNIRCFQKLTWIFEVATLIYIW